MRTNQLAGRVIAVLRNAVYLESDSGHIISIVDGEVDGSLTLRVANVFPLLAALKASPCETFQATEDTLHIDEVARIAWAHAPEWAPRLPEKVGPASLRLEASYALAGAIADAGRLEGFGPLAKHVVGARRAVPLRAGTHLDAMSSCALATLNRAREAAHMGNYAEVSDALIALIGLGPDLTPSGDDLVAGIVAALVWQARRGCVPAALTRRVVESVRETAPSKTNRISARLLWHACDGVLYAPAMKLGAALLSGDVDAMLIEARELFSIGHTTGVDLSVGLLAGTLLGVGREAVTCNDARSVPI